MPETSNAHVDASMTSVDLLVSPQRGDVAVDEVLRAASIVDRAGVDPDDRERLCAAVFEATFRLLRDDPDAFDPDTTVFDVPCREHDLRLALESTYRSMARHAPTRAERIELVDRANSIRPRSIL